MTKEIEAITKDVDANVTKEVIIICNKFKEEIMRCVQCPSILECKYPKRRLDPLKEEAKEMAEKVYEEEIELDGSAENIIRAQQKRDYTYQNYMKDNAPKQLANERCKFEREEILNMLQKFVNAGYDLLDPRCSLIVNELIGNVLNSGRANKTFTSLGVLLRKDTSAGPIYYQNPLLSTKMQFSRLIIDATEVLDRILKSDEAQKADKNFTDHLISALKIREQKKAGLIDSLHEDKE